MCRINNIDVQSYIDYFCFEIYVANCDSIANNYATWKSKEGNGKGYNDGKWRFLLYDTDDSDGMVTSMSSANVDSFVSGHWTKNPMGENGDIIFSAMIRNHEFRERFVTTFMDMANYNFAYPRVHEKIENIAQQYCAADVASQQRFRGTYNIGDYTAGPMYSGIYTDKHFQQDARIIDDFFRNRKSYMMTYMKQDLDLTGSYKDISVSCSIDGAADIEVNTLMISGTESAWTGQYITDYPVRLVCKPQDGYQFVEWKVDGKISKSSVIEVHPGENRNIEAVVEAN